MLQSMRDSSHILGYNMLTVQEKTVNSKNTVPNQVINKFMQLSEST